MSTSKAAQAGFQLGDRVLYTHVLGRSKSGSARVWNAHKCRATVGIVCGKRTLSNGTVEAYREFDGYGSFTVSHEYCPSEHFQAYLIAYDLRSKPVLVHADHVTSVSEGASVSS